MKALEVQSGFTSPWALLVVVLSAASGYIFGLLSQYIDATKPVMPIVLMGVLLLPSGLTTQLIFKLNETKKIKGLSREERRRMDGIIAVKNIKLYMLLAFYAISAAIIGGLFYAATLPAPAGTVLLALRSTGFLLATSCSMAIYSVVETRKIIEFEAKIAQRSNERKATAALIKRMKESSPSSDKSS